MTVGATAVELVAVELGHEPLGCPEVVDPVLVADDRQWHLGLGEAPASPDEDVDELVLEPRVARRAGDGRSTSCSRRTTPATPGWATMPSSAASASRSTSDRRRRSCRIRVRCSEPNLLARSNSVRRGDVVASPSWTTTSPAPRLRLTWTRPIVTWATVVPWGTTTSTAPGMTWGNPQRTAAVACESAAPSPACQSASRYRWSRSSRREPTASTSGVIGCTMPSRPSLRTTLAVRPSR